MGEEAVIEIAYLCDGLDICSDKVGCYRCLKPGISYCHHTFNQEHAINGTVDDPEKYPERFNRFEFYADNKMMAIQYWEGPVDIPWESQSLS